MSRHKQLVAQLLAQEPTARTTLFMQAVHTIIGYTLGYTMKPDAWSLDMIGSKVTAYEIECSSAITPKKMADYIDLWWAFDFIEWEFELVTYDHNGVRRVADLFIGPLQMIAAAKMNDEVAHLRNAAKALEL